MFAIVTAITAPVSAQIYQRRANLVGNPNAGRGKCTVEVVVDGAAEVEIRGEMENLLNLSGQPPQWRRFECSGPLPGNPADFRFAGVDGRGRQQLIRDPRNGGLAVVRIEDPGGGAEGYTFHIEWSGGSSYYRGERRNQYGDRCTLSTSRLFPSPRPASRDQVPFRCSSLVDYTGWACAIIRREVDKCGSQFCSCSPGSTLTGAAIAIGLGLISGWPVTRPERLTVR